MKGKKQNVIISAVLPSAPEAKTIYHLTPVDFNLQKYLARTDRNNGYLSIPYKDQEKVVLGSTVGVAGCGGMGGSTAISLLRLGTGTLKIADCETFDESNKNRQAAANSETIGKSKAFETAREMRKISEDTNLLVFPDGITEGSVHQFVEGCDIVLDLIEFWAIGARLLLHKVCRELNVPILNANSVGFASFLFYFTADRMPLAEAMSITYEEGKVLEEKLHNNTATKADRKLVMDKILTFFVPKENEYSKDPARHSTSGELRRRLLEEGKASIIATNPPFASGFLGDWVLLQLLSWKAAWELDIETLPLMPGYLMIDVAKGKVEKKEGVWWL